MSNEMVVTHAGNTITSLELVDQINMFRGEDGKHLRHDNLMSVIRDEFDEEISLLKIQESDYTNSRGKTYPMFVLTHNQAKQVLVRESKQVRKAVIKYIETLERELNKPKTIEELKDELLIAYEQRELEQKRSVKYGYKSVIGKKDKVINGIKDITGTKLQRDIVSDVKSISDELADIKDENYIPVMRVLLLNNKKTAKGISTKKLISTSKKLGYEIKTIPDAKFGHVNKYHIDIWKSLYNYILN